MNLFWLRHKTTDKDNKPIVDLCDKHVVKMPLEHAQLLKTAHAVADHNGAPPPIEKFSSRGHSISKVYKPTHKNHPCAIAVRRSRTLYKRVAKYGVDICLEYTRRYNKTHACEPILRALLAVPPTNQTSEPYKRETTLGLLGPDGEFPAEFVPLCVPDDCFVKSSAGSHYSAPQSYRRYYNTKKDKIATWKHTPTPNWITFNSK